MFNRTAQSAFLFAAFFAGSLLPLSVCAQSYSIVDLDAAAPYSTGLNVTGINNFGEVVGNVSTPAGTTAFSYANGAMTLLPFASAAAVNDGGQIAGDNGGDAVLYSSGTLTDLGEGAAVAINSSGEVVGNDQNHPFTWNGGTRKDLSPIIIEGTCATATNDAGEIVGYDSDGYWQDAVAYGPGYYIGDLNGYSDGAVPGFRTATGIDDTGQIIGIWQDAHNQSWGGVIFGGGGAIFAGFVPDGINSSGAFVGYNSSLGDALLGDSAGQFDLNNLIPPGSGWRLENGVGINNDGWIICQGLNAEGLQDGFLLIPTPEPASAAILLPAALWAVTRRRCKSR